MSEPPREARWEVGETGVGARGVVLQRDIVRQRALGASAWSGYAGGLNNDRRLVRVVLAVLGSVDEIDVLGASAARDVAEDGPSARGLLVFWRLGDGGARGGGTGGGTAGGVDQRL